MIILREDSAEPTLSVSESFRAFGLALKNMLAAVSRGMKLPEISRTILAFLRRVPVIRGMIKNQKSEEDSVRESLDTIATGDVVTGIFNLLNKIVEKIWALIPVSSGIKENTILPMFNYNDRRSYLQALYKIMIDNDIEPKYARALIVVVVCKIPIYQIMYAFKPFWSKAKTNETTDDKIHPFTAGNPNTNKETGLNEVDTILQKKVQKFIQISKTSLNEIETRRKLSWEIIKESIMAVVGPILAHNFYFLRLSFGFSENNVIAAFIDGSIRMLILAYYYYFLVTALILASLAIKNEDDFNPAVQGEKEEKTDDIL